MKMLAVILVFTVVIANSQSSVRVCSDHPNGLPSYNPDWYYFEFSIPEQMKLESTYGGFTRTSWYSNAEHDYIAQYFQVNTPPSSLNDHQLWNYDNIHESMYNREWDISELGLMGSGTLRISAPLTHFVTWHEACVTYSPIDSPIDAIPEPKTSFLVLAGAVAMLFRIRKKTS